MKTNRRIEKFISTNQEMTKIKDSVGFAKGIDIITEARNCFDGLSLAREDRRRNRKYTFPKNNGQWSDPMEGNATITEAQHISNQGKTPLQYNMILPTVQTVLGQFRGNQTEPVCVARDREEQGIGEMMSIAVQYAYQLNDLWELDGNNLLEALISGTCFWKTTFGFIPALQKCDVKVELPNLTKMFFNPMDDPRNWDCTIIGQVYDTSIADIISNFSNGSRSRALEIKQLYAGCTDAKLGYMYGNLSTRRADAIDFFRPVDTTKCRVIEVWKMESKEKFWCHDTLEGDSYWTPIDQKANIEAVNNFRIQEAAKFGIEPKHIEYKWGIHQYWYFRYLTPTGEILSEGETPYWHGSHPYTLKRFSSIDGDVHSFVESMIDAQRMFNRSLTQLDFINGASAKGVLAIAEGTLTDNGQTTDDIASEYRKVGGVFMYKPRTDVIGGGIPQEIISKSSNTSAAEMANLIRGLLPDLTGVHGALQGRQAQSGTSGRLYEAEVANSMTNLVDTFESYKSARTERDKKVMQVIQQYYTSPTYINIAGKQFSEASKWYDPRKVMNAEMDLSLSESTASVNYRTLMEGVMQEMWKSGAITIKNWLSNSSMPFADKLLQGIEVDEKALMEQQAAMGGGMQPQLQQGQQQQLPQGKQPLQLPQGQVQ